MGKRDNVYAVMSTSASPIYGIIASAASVSEVFTLSSTFISASDPTYAQIGIRVDTNGKLYKRENYSIIQVNSATDWVFPRDNFPTNAALYQARCTTTGSIGGVHPNSETFGSWVVLTAGSVSASYVEWGHDMYRFDIGNGTITLDIRFGNGTDPINTATSVFDSAPCLVSRTYSVHIEAN